MLILTLSIQMFIKAHTTSEWALFLDGTHPLSVSTFSLFHLLNLILPCWTKGQVFTNRYFNQCCQEQFLKSLYDSDNSSHPQPS